MRRHSGSGRPRMVEPGMQAVGGAAFLTPDS